MTKPLYTAEAHVTGGRAQGHGRTTDGRLEVDLRQPKELGGDGEGTNPEQLFAIGYAACFATVLSLVGRSRNLDADDAEVDARVALVPSGTGAFGLAVGLDIVLPSMGDAEQRADLVRTAHLMCPYSNATRGNIDVTLMVDGAAV
ncbi:organic hydroperoxide resistance protein [Streptomyces poriferorum]|uniref:organic hydroperoxide resistance protein n=1 Tax=Streptomyces poriferorum TaxID=2798799 RepID=UPI00273D08CE|nr:organic hydroperoxide resistance protein [Streptomyces sp. Alt1]WLQ49410.1 organic hydroperoxide resistance protein [Streptomyces sp. Alt1]